jgi:glycosyltransferase involved in cell wall biosynthesis
MPCFNAVQTIAAAIASVQDQTLDDWELICVDDASTDATRGLIEALAAADSRIRLIANHKNLGAARARNLALDAARGSHVAFLDADDLWMPEKLAIQLPVMATGARFSYATYAFLAAHNRPSKLVVPPRELSLRRACFGNPIGNLTVMLDRTWLADRRFPIRGHEDYAFWLQLLRDTDAVRAGGRTPLALYRRTPHSLSANKLRALRWTWSVLREEAGLPPLTAAICLGAHAVRGVTKHYF